jgi:hypothetical protein
MTSSCGHGESGFYAFAYDGLVDSGKGRDGFTEYNFGTIFVSVEEVRGSYGSVCNILFAHEGEVAYGGSHEAQKSVFFIDGFYGGVEASKDAFSSWVFYDEERATSFFWSPFDISEVVDFLESCMVDTGILREVSETEGHFGVTNESDAMIFGVVVVEAFVGESGRHIVLRQWF